MPEPEADARQCRNPHRNFAGHLSLLPTLNAPLTDAPLAEQLVIDCERKLGILRLGIRESIIE